MTLRNGFVFLAAVVLMAGGCGCTQKKFVLNADLAAKVLVKGNVEFNDTNDILCEYFQRVSAEMERRWTRCDGNEECLRKVDADYQGYFSQLSAKLTDPRLGATKGADERDKVLAEAREIADRYTQAGGR